MEKKKLSILLYSLILYFVIGSVTFAADIHWYNANQATILWNEVTTDVDEDTITGVTYEVLLSNIVSDPDKTNPELVYAGPDTSATITLQSKGKYFVGVRAVLEDLKSEINWADLLEENMGVPSESEPFGVKWMANPNSVTNLRK